MDYSDLETRLGYIFKNQKHLEKALTHSSYANEVLGDRLECNERLEFLGDAVLQISISEHLFRMYPKKPEGALTRIRANLVCEDALYHLANKLEISSFIKLGVGESKIGGKHKKSILADTMEAIFAAIYLDGGIMKSKKIVVNLYNSYVNMFSDQVIKRDYKSLLQEHVQKKSNDKVIYSLIGTIGPDHDKTFLSEIVISKKVYGRGKGKTKKESEQNAARHAVIKMGILKE